ncbi:MAG: agarase, partial [Bacteroidota bacterium]
INDDIRVDFLGIVSEQYYKVVSGVIRKYDPNHMYLGSRLHGKPKFIPGILKSAGKYADIVSVNYYGYWEPEQDHFKNWDKWAGKPILITEFYTKGDDSGLPNNSGAGWRVKTQNDRGVFYENFCIKLIRMKNCVGWQWFRYMDNDPTDTLADPSNSDSNKGIVDNMYDYYDALTDHMLRLNNNRFGLIQYFDNENPHAGNSLP